LSEDSERVATLLCFLHRKIEQQVFSTMEKSIEKNEWSRVDGKVRLFNHEKILNALNDSTRDVKFDESFAFLDKAGLAGYVMQ
jgi:hypothetical protein